MIYADNAATTKLDNNAFEAMKPFLINEYGNASQPYSFAKPAKKALSAARESIASCINAAPEEIYFTSGGTESDNWAIKGSALSDPQKQATITSKIEHHAVLKACATIEQLGYPVVYLPVTNEGIICPGTLEHYMTNTTKLVSVMLANNEIGTIEPITELCKIAHKYGAIFHTDAVQAVGHIPINVRQLGVDMLSASAHKFNGMKGCGFLYVRKGIKIPSYLDGGAQEYGKRAGTENVAAIIAMATALRINCERMEKTTKKLNHLEELFLDRFNETGIDFRRNGSINHLPGSINISIKNADGEMLLHRLDLKGICVSSGAACDSVNTQVSHVINAIKVPKVYAKGTIRITFGIDNNEKDAIEIADALANILQ